MSSRKYHLSRSVNVRGVNVQIYTTSHSNQRFGYRSISINEVINNIVNNISIILKEYNRRASKNYKKINFNVLDRFNCICYNIEMCEGNSQGYKIRQHDGLTLIIRTVFAIDGKGYTPSTGECVYINEPSHEWYKAEYYKGIYKGTWTNGGTCDGSTKKFLDLNYTEDGEPTSYKGWLKMYDPERKAIGKEVARRKQKAIEPSEDEKEVMSRFDIEKILNECLNEINVVGKIDLDSIQGKTKRLKSPNGEYRETQTNTAFKERWYPEVLLYDKTNIPSWILNYTSDSVKRSGDVVIWTMDHSILRSKDRSIKITDAVDMIKSSLKEILEKIPTKQTDGSVPKNAMILDAKTCICCVVLTKENAGRKGELDIIVQTVYYWDGKSTMVDPIIINLDQKSENFTEYWYDYQTYYKDLWTNGGNASSRTAEGVAEFIDKNYDENLMPTSVKGAKEMGDKEKMISTHLNKLQNQRRRSEEDFMYRLQNPYYEYSDGRANDSAREQAMLSAENDTLRRLNNGSISKLPRFKSLGDYDDTGEEKYKFYMQDPQKFKYNRRDVAIKHKPQKPKERRKEDMFIDGLINEIIDTLL